MNVVMIIEILYHEKFNSKQHHSWCHSLIQRKINLKIIWMFLFEIGIGGNITNVIFVSVKYFSYPVSMKYTLNDEPFV